MAAAPKPEKPLMPPAMAERLRELVLRRAAEMQEAQARRYAEREAERRGY